MTQVIDINQPALQQSLNETIVWCAHRQLAAAPLDNQDVRRRLKLMDEASDLMRQAMNESESRINRFLRRRYWGHKKYRRGLELMADAGVGSVGSFAKRLRTPELKAEIDYTIAPDSEGKQRIVESLVYARSILVERLEQKLGEPHHAQGRLLSYWPDESLACGAAEVQSLGFFDTDNTPPWDLWVAFSDRVLLSWVPGELVELVQRGIDANPEGCIAWFQ